MLPNSNPFSVIIQSIISPERSTIRRTNSSLASPSQYSIQSAINSSSSKNFSPLFSSNFVSGLIAIGPLVVEEVPPTLPAVSKPNTVAPVSAAFAYAAVPAPPSPTTTTS